MSTTIRERFAATKKDEGRPCRVCGLAVKRPDAAQNDSVNYYGPDAQAKLRQGLPAALGVPAERFASQLAVTVCDECTETSNQAAAIIAEHPRIARRHGNVGAERVHAALIAIELAGLGGHRGMVRNLTETDEALHLLIENVAHLGGAAAWLRTGRGKANPKRWAHVSDDDRREARAECWRLLRRQLERPAPFGPPLGDNVLRGCGFCGCGSIEVRESEAAAAWGSVVLIQPGVVGGPMRPERLAAHLCPKCRRSLGDVGGAMGLPAVERAVLDFLGRYREVVGWTLQFKTMPRAWAALRPGTAVNATPWAHLPMDGYRSILSDLHGRNRVRVESNTPTWPRQYPTPTDPRESEPDPDPGRGRA